MWWVKGLAKRSRPHGSSTPEVLSVCLDTLAALG
jgi:hypothetical protein